MKISKDIADQGHQYSEAELELDTILWKLYRRKIHVRTALRLIAELLNGN